MIETSKIESEETPLRPANPVSAPEIYYSTCPTCDGLIDVTECEPYSKVLCPHCQESVRVRRKFDHFVITRQLGEGGMSRVFDATDETLGRHVALKILHRHYSQVSERIMQFEREAQLTAAVSHPNVVKLFSVGRDQGNFYIAMEMVGSGSLDQRIAKQERVEEKEVLRIGRAVAEGLRSAYREGLIHRDVKPGNILFTEDDTPKIVDFGLALFHERDVDDSGEIWATPFYVAPEKVAENREDFRSDIYSLGATLYHALVGKPPYKADTNSIQELIKIKSKAVRLEDSGLRFSPRTCELINRMLALKPEDRFESYDDLVENFRDAEALVGYSLMSRRAQRQRIFYLAAGAIGCVLLLGALMKPETRSKVQSIQTGKGVNEKEINSLAATIAEGKSTVADLFIDARTVLLDGNYVGARKQFDELIGTHKAKQPTLNWARFNAALCAIVGGQKAEAEKYFADIHADAKQGEDIGGHNQSEFFTKLGERMSDGLGLQLKRKDFDYPKDSEQVLGYLAHGLAQWHFGKAASAVEWLETFNATQPPKGFEWIGSYKKLIAPYIADVAVAKKLLAARKLDIAEAASRTQDEARTSLEEAQQALAQLKTDGSVKRVLALRVKRLEDELAKMKRDAQRADAERLKELRKRELAQWNDIVGNLPALARGYDVSQVVGLLKSIHFEAPEVQTAVDSKLYLWSKAEEFIETLMDDIKQKGYTGTITRRTGTPLQGRLTKLGYNEARMMLDRGEIGIPTEMLAPDQLVTMAQKFNESVSDATDYYRREELIVVFAKMQGLDDMANAVATQLMEENRGFRQRWMRVAQAGL